MKTLTSSVGILEKIGFKIQFQATESGIKSLTTNRLYTPQEITIINSFTFENEPGKGDTTVLYALETNNGERGTITETWYAAGEPKTGIQSGLHPISKFLASK